MPGQHIFEYSDESTSDKSFGAACIGKIHSSGNQWDGGISECVLFLQAD